MGALLSTGAALWDFARSPLGRWVLAGIAVVALLAGVHHHGVTQGRDRERAAQAARLDRARKDVVRREAVADAITAVVARKSEARQAEIRWRTITTIREVPVYVTAETDRRFPVPVGLVRVHDAAARGLSPTEVPDPAGRPDDAPSGIAASAFGETLAANYGSCLADLERFRDLQGWVDQQARAWVAAAPPPPP